MRGHGRKVAGWALVGALWLLSPGFVGVAGAAPAKAAKADDPDTVKAREFIKKANVHYKVGEYEPAIAAYKEAYKLRSVPALLFNIAQGYRLLGDFKQAKFFYEGCLRDDPEALYAAEAKQRLDEVIEKLALTPAPAPVAPVVTPAPVKPAPTTGPVVAEKPVAPPVPPEALAPPASPVSSSEGESEGVEADGPKVLPIALAAAAGVLGIVSGALYGLAQSNWTAVTKAERTRVEVDQLIGAADTQRMAAIGAGVCAIGAGVGAAVTFVF